MHIHLFNPENDLALASGCSNYTPPPHAVAIHNAGALLPLWWAENGDSVIIPSRYHNDGIRLAARLGLDINLIDSKSGSASGLTDFTDSIPTPWGWSHNAVRQFRCAGAVHNLPDDETIDRMRRLSHRRSSIAILNELNLAMDESFPVAVEATSPEIVIETEKSFPGCFIKSPWSGSGRGIFQAQNIPEQVLAARVSGIIRRQGCVMVEKGLDKLLDFAALFYCDTRPDSGPDIRFEGLSLFSAESRGMYDGNIVAPQSILRQRLATYIDISRLDTIISHLQNILGNLLGNDYRGYCGIDMMIYHEDGVIKIQPCVEMNLRMTMGVVAMKICERLRITSPKYLKWHFSHHASPHSDISHIPLSEQLLPPSEGFTLRLSEPF